MANKVNLSAPRKEQRFHRFTHNQVLMCVWMYVSMYVYIYMYVCYTYLCMYIYICTFVYVCIYIYVRLLYVYMYVCYTYQLPIIMVNLATRKEKRFHRFIRPSSWDLFLRSEPPNSMRVNVRTSGANW